MEDTEEGVPVSLEEAVAQAAAKAAAQWVRNHPNDNSIRSSSVVQVSLKRQTGEILTVTSILTNVSTTTVIIPGFEQCMRQDEIGLHILSFFDASDVVRSKRVSKRWKRLCDKAMDKNFQPIKQFTSTNELKEIVKKYCQYLPSLMNEIARTYGFPIGKWKVGLLKNFSFVFHRQGKFNEDINAWDTSNAERLFGMLCGCRSFNKPLDKWDTGKVKDMQFMFEGARMFNQPLNSWDTSKVEDIGSMFRGAKSFNQPLNQWNMSNVESTSSTFEDAVAFNQDLSTWDTGRLCHAQGMFRGAVSFNHPIATWDVHSVRPDPIVAVRLYNGILYGATAFEQALPDGWDPAVAFAEPLTDPEEVDWSDDDTEVSIEESSDGNSEEEDDSEEEEEEEEN